ncbi:zinc finger CCHC domain-containing protein 8-like isoform X2 [Ostrea edulis]|uniref:zinc finger CCHC domain-containing protein 8-like isoform X2 n=1 Tax=Ostrea edulis TaxID=37623 RepID=UPI002095ECBE|nr:zinc finger CCHC domain-containing protein 8-like isoform X2 [Ostrea edulis]
MELGDVFGGVSMLFDEFEKDRDSSTFISFNRTNDGQEDRSKIVFTKTGLHGKSTDEESENEGTVEVGLSESDYSLIVPEGMFNESEVKEMKCGNDSKFKLTHEKNKFQRFASIIDSTRYVHDEESPGCQIIFHNNRFSRKYRPEIERYIFRLMEMDSCDSEILPNLKLKASTPTCVDINGKLDSSVKTSEMWEAHAIIGASQFHRECIIDRLGFLLTGQDTSLTYGWEMPVYEQVFIEALPADESEKSSKPERMKQSCFNCGGNHRINECAEPKNFQRIRENKNKFMQQSQKQGLQRYHAEGEVDPRFASFKPGIISHDLQKALDISSKEIPLYIYHMRQLGYPPGWMQEALLQDSGISIFDKDGNEVLVTGEMMEDGEIKDRLPNEGQIDPEKIIEYPGFTVNPPEGVQDEYEKCGSIPMQTCQLVSTLRKDLKDLSKSKKRKLEEERESKKRSQKMGSKETDMDIEEESPSTSVNGHVFVPPLPVETPSSKPPLPKDHPPPTPPAPKLSLPKMAREISITERSKSPSLEELESQLKLLQDKLASNETDVDLQILDSCGASDEENSPEVAELLMLKEKLLKRTDSISSIQTFGELGSGGSCPGTPQPTPNTNTGMNSVGSLHQSKSISKDYGTPILKGPIESLPDSSKFGEGIEDHIPYENLPDATGTYDKIRELISRVRTIKKKRKNNH